MELDSIPVFVKVAQLGSFTQASKALNMPSTTVSAKVALLERQLGVTLIQRTTRKLNLTEAGRIYLERCVRALNELQEAQSELQTSSKEIQGSIKVTASVDVGQSLLAKIVERYLKLHPKMKVQLIVTNRIVDLVGEGVDLGVRAGQLKDSSLMTKKFMEANFGLWASKAYLKKAGTPKETKDLAKHQFIHFAPLKTDAMEFTSGKQTLMLDTSKGSIQVDDFGTSKALAERDLGIALMPDFLCENDSGENKLVKVLPEWSANGGSFSLVYPAQQFVTPKVRAFIDVAIEFFKRY